MRADRMGSDQVTFCGSLAFEVVHLDEDCLSKALAGGQRHQAMSRAEARLFDAQLDRP